jgi:flavin reductase (DIM6/NTAB) family NADH-FMN oxidoreductase RutF
VTIETFDELVGRLNYPMFMVTVAGERERDGCLVGFTTRSSVDPPRFIVCLSDKNRTFRIGRDTDVMVVHLVPADALELAELFGSCTGDEVDKFERCGWSPGPESTPPRAMRVPCTSKIPLYGERIGAGGGSSPCPYVEVADCRDFGCVSGGSGIRTHGPGRPGTTVFETAARWSP